MNLNKLTKNSKVSNTIYRKQNWISVLVFFCACQFCFQTGLLQAQTNSAAQTQNGVIETEQTSNAEIAQAANSVSTKRIQDQVVPIGSEYHNSIRLLNNRFRIDSDIKEVTLVFFRQFGAPPIVLVKPDGSKLYLENDPGDDSYNWFETDTYDMIALKEPMPGPWQAVGEVLTGSRVMVIAEITLQAEPIPNVVFSGETLKQTAYLQNAGSKVDLTAFRDVVTLSVDFMSTNNPNYPNFGLGSRSVARFEDNGLGYDEVEADGVFTGQFDLQIVEGEWQPIFTLRTPLFSREQVNDRVVLLPNPIKLSHSVEYNEQKDHLLMIDADTDYVDLSSLVVDGTIRQPSGEVTRFSITEVTDSVKTVDIVNTEFGIYKININVYAQSKTGRNLVLTVPEYSFVTEAPPIIEEAVEELVLDPELDPANMEAVEESSPIMLVIVINLTLLIVGCLGFYLIVDKRNNPDNHAIKKLMAKLKQIKLRKKKVDVEPEKAPEEKPEKEKEKPEAKA